MTTPTERCRCGDVARLENDDAIAYSQGHLRLERVAGDAWSSDWRCPVSGACWLERYHLSWGPSRRWVSLERIAAPIGEPAPRRAPLPARTGPRAAGTHGRWLVAATGAALAAVAGAGLVA